MGLAAFKKTTNPPGRSGDPLTAAEYRLFFAHIERFADAFNNCSDRGNDGLSIATAPEKTTDLSFFLKIRKKNTGPAADGIGHECREQMEIPYSRAVNLNMRDYPGQRLVPGLVVGGHAFNLSDKAQFDNALIVLKRQAEDHIEHVDLVAGIRRAHQEEAGRRLRPSRYLDPAP